ncbi:MAG: ferrochelatase [Acidimicrobiales bacterium]
MKSDGEALLIVSFGGPEQPPDVRPFLENVTRGRGISAERLDEVEAHYQTFGGRSPINDQVRALIGAVRGELDRRGHHAVPIFWGNRNWHPYLRETLAEMADAGVSRAYAFVTSAYSSYSGCRQYRENLAEAAAPLGARAPQVDKLRVYFDHPGFIEPMAERLGRALSQLDSVGASPSGGPLDGEAISPGPVQVLFTAHSIPVASARTCAYEDQLRAAAALVCARLDRPVTWELVWQSRSGPPQVPWLEPDVTERVEQLAAAGVRRLVLAPIGFVSDHLEVLYDLDTVALARAAELGVTAVRAETVGTDPRFVSMVVDLMEERRAALAGLTPARPALSDLGVWPDRCAPECCPVPQRPAPAATPSTDLRARPV